MSHYPLKSWEHGSQRQSVDHGSLQKLTSTRAAFARPGPRNVPVPRRHRSYAALRLPASIGRGSGSPCQWPPSWWTRVLCLNRPTTRASTNVPCVGDGSSALRDTGVVFEEKRGPPRLRGHPLCTCCGRTPRRIWPPPRPTHAGGHCCLRCIPGLSASGKTLGFGAAVPRPARSRAYASPMAFRPPSQGWLPAGRAHPWPGGFRTRWMTNKISWRTCVLQSQLTHRAWSH